MGILSFCDCSRTSFLEADLKDFGSLTTETTVWFNDAPVILTLNTGDSVSYVCGSAGTGLDYCGDRIITLKCNGIDLADVALPFL